MQFDGHDLRHRTAVSRRTSIQHPNTPQGGREGGATLTQWDTNRNRRISCAEARAHGIVPVRRGHPAYPFMLDGDGDGVVCE